MIDAAAPVTRLTTFVVVPANALVNVAVSPARTLKSLKLWNKLPPACVPSVSGIA